MPRVQTPDLQEAPVRPVAAPVNTFIQQGPMGDGLVEALGRFSPTLARIGERRQAAEREQQEALAEGRIGGMTFDEARQHVRAGNLPEFANPWFRAAFERQYGIRLGNEARRNAASNLATTDLSTVDANEFAAQQIRPGAEEAQQSGSRFMLAGFNEATRGLPDEIGSKVDEDRVNRTVAQRNSNAVANFSTRGEWLGSELADPQAVRDTLSADMRDNRDTLGMSYESQEPLLLATAQALALRPGMGNVIAGIASIDRGGVPLSSRYPAQFETLRLQAQASTLHQETQDIRDPLIGFYTSAGDGNLDVDAFNTFQAAHPEVLPASTVASILERNTNAQQAALAHAQSELHRTARDRWMAANGPRLVELARTGGIGEIAADEHFQDETGATIDVPRADLREYALSQASAQIASEGTAQNLDPLTIRQNQVAMYAQNGEVDPLSQSRLTAFLHATSGTGDVPLTSLEYLPELAAVNNASPEMIRQIAPSEADRLFIDTVTVAMDLGRTPAEALREARFRRDNAATLTLPAGQERRNYIDHVVRGLDNEGWFGSHQNHSRVLLDHYVAERLDYFASTGATGQDLERRVRASFQNTHVFFRGRLIDVTGTGTAAPATQPIFAEAATAVAEANTQYHAGDITFVPMNRGSDRFQAVTAAGVPIPGTVLTWAEMRRQYQARRTHRLSDRANRAAQAHRDITPLPLIQGATMGPN